MGDHIADIHVGLGPGSPGVRNVRRFLQHVAVHVDDFIYGDRCFQRRVW